MAADKTKLSFNTSVARYKKLERADDRPALAQFIRDRFDERYFCPIESTPMSAKHGFMIMAVCCIVIEALEAFYQGEVDTRNKSRKLFADFFKHDTPLKVFADNSNWFYTDIRCGILHQCEARRGWRILRNGPLLDTTNKQINATKFMKELKKVVYIYAEQISIDDELCKLFKKKMKSVCDNCT